MNAEDASLRAIALWISIAIIVFAIWAAWSAALAHGPEQWIQDKNLHDPVTNSFCCGPMDCFALADNQVKEVSGGFDVSVDEHMVYGFMYKAFTEFVPYNRAMPFSPDGQAHACVTWNDATKKPGIRCFIIPPGST